MRCVGSCASLWILAAQAALGAVCLLGCAGERAAERQLAEMHEQVSKMQAENEKFDTRIGALADDKDPPPPTANASASAGSAVPAGAVIVTGQLPVRAVQLGGPSDEPADPNDASPRPDIRLSGQAGGITAPRPRSGKANARGRTSDEAELPGLRADEPRSSALDPEAKRAYETALGQVQAKQFDRGLEGLNAFLVRWPDHPYAENALYWRGEAYFAKGEYLRAAEQFDAVLTRFGGGTKGPDALPKLGMCHDRLGAPQRAREFWDRLKNDFPRSDAAKKIPAATRDAAPGNRAGGSGSRDDSSPKGPKENR